MVDSDEMDGDAGKLTGEAYKVAGKSKLCVVDVTVEEPVLSISSGATATLVVHSVTPTKHYQ